jgi:D-alanyl-lipoteichoic acid acyltransferase DltB (MBOAT superfamily)/lysophospholipase L1-like esterase
MKSFFENIVRESRRLFYSRPGCIYFIFLGMGCGYSFYSGICSYSSLSALIIKGHAARGPGIMPLADLFSPCFRFCYAYAALFLPAVFTKLIAWKEVNEDDDELYTFFGVNPSFSAKFLSGVLFLSAGFIVSIPIIFYWRILGGYIDAHELLMLYMGYFLHGIFALTISLFFMLLFKNRIISIIAAILVLISPHALDLSTGSLFAGRFLVSAVLKPLMIFFKNGVLTPVGFLYFSIPPMALYFISYGLFKNDSGPKSRIMALLLAVSIVAGLAMAGTGRPALLDKNIDMMERGRCPAFSMISMQVERALNAPPVEISQVTDACGRTGHAPDAVGRPMIIEVKDRRDILVLYFVVLPLLLGLVISVRIMKFSDMMSGRKRIIAALGTWAVLLFCLSLVQDVYVKNRTWKIVPSVREILPRWIGGLDLQFGKKAASVSPERAADQVGPDKRSGGFLYADADYRNLRKFFKKLSDLQANRRDTVRIVHYGDSLIWADCYARTMKRLLQKEFGDGGRGIVPPVETLATTLQDHVNKTQPEGFELHALRHTFRQGGRFYLKPEVNQMVGFTGESAFLRSPRSEIQMEVPAGSGKWKLVRVFVRMPGGTNRAMSECRVNLDYGSGIISKSLKLGADSTRIATFDIPPCEKININFDGSIGELPSVDAVDVETGSGIVYSTVVRMGIHMSWMNAIPDRSLIPLKEIYPDLLIFQFGINEAASLGAFPEFTKDILRSQMREWLAKIKRLLLETDIILIGPPERLMTQQGVLAPMREARDVSQVQREEAARAGVAYFDTYESLGGEGQMLKMAGTGLAMNDYTHFTIRGGDIAAEGFFNALMDAYRKKSERPRLDFSIEEKTAILFNSPSYAYFLAAVIIITLLIGRRPAIRFAFLTAASYYFYSTWKVWPLACLAATTLTDYSMALLIKRARDHNGRGSVFLGASLAVDLGILFALKYFDFFSDLTGKAANALGYQASVPILNILLPVGISFYTFQSLSYTIDVWRGKIEPEKSFFTYALYVSMFTQLLAGPIVKAREFLPALKDKASHFVVTHGHVATAFFLILAGLVKKAGADWLAGSIVDRVYASPQMFMPLETLTAVYAYGLQIYGDFSGYSDIAIGSAMLLGFNLTANFRRPYASSSISEFWQRWHISLGSWLRDSLYISLGGNRKRVLFNIGLTMFLCGLWHGAAVPFVLWGMYHGFFMILERICGLNRLKAANPFFRGLRVFATLHLVLFGWIIFRSDSWGTFTGILHSLFQLKAGAPNVGIVLVAVMAAFYGIHFTPIDWKERLKSAWAGLPATLQGLIATCVTLFLYNIGTAEVKPFIYFQF